MHREERNLWVASLTAAVVLIVVLVSAQGTWDGSTSRAVAEPSSPTTGSYCQFLKQKADSLKNKPDDDPAKIKAQKTYEETCSCNMLNKKIQDAKLLEDDSKDRIVAILERNFRAAGCDPNFLPPEPTPEPEPTPTPTPQASSAHSSVPRPAKDLTSYCRKNYPVSRDSRERAMVAALKSIKRDQYDPRKTTLSAREQEYQKLLEHFRKPLTDYYSQYGTRCESLVNLTCQAEMHPVQYCDENGICGKWRCERFVTYASLDQSCEEDGQLFRSCDVYDMKKCGVQTCLHEATRKQENATKQACPIDSVPYCTTEKCDDVVCLPGVRRLSDPDGPGGQSPLSECDTFLNDLRTKTASVEKAMQALALVRPTNAADAAKPAAVKAIQEAAAKVSELRAELVYLLEKTPTACNALKLARFGNEEARNWPANRCYLKPSSCPDSCTLSDPSCLERKFLPYTVLAKDPRETNCSDGYSAYLTCDIYGRSGSNDCSGSTFACLRDATTKDEEQIGFRCVEEMQGLVSCDTKGKCSLMCALRGNPEDSSGGQGTRSSAREAARSSAPFKLPNDLKACLTVPGLVEPLRKEVERVMTQTDIATQQRSGFAELKTRFTRYRAELVKHGTLCNCKAMQDAQNAMSPTDPDYAKLEAALVSLNCTYRTDGKGIEGRPDDCKKFPGTVPYVRCSGNLEDGSGCQWDCQVPNVISVMAPEQTCKTGTTKRECIINDGLPVDCKDNCVAPANRPNDARMPYCTVDYLSGISDCSQAAKPVCGYGCVRKPLNQRKNAVKTAGAKSSVPWKDIDPKKVKNFCRDYYAPTRLHYQQMLVAALKKAGSVKETQKQTNPAVLKAQETLRDFTMNNYKQCLPEKWNQNSWLKSTACSDTLPSFTTPVAICTRNVDLKLVCGDHKCADDFVMYDTGKACTAKDNNQKNPRPGTLHRACFLTGPESCGAEYCLHKPTQNELDTQGEIIEDWPRLTWCGNPTRPMNYGKCMPWSWPVFK